MLRHTAAALILLAPSLRAQQHLDTVRVTSRASASLVTPTRSVEVISRDDLTRRAARSLSDILTLALGVDLQPRSPAQADLGLRGSTFNQVVVLVDGMRVSDVQSGHYALDLAVPLSAIDHIEILRGTGSALYGSDAIGGVVNIVTRAERSFGELGTRVGSFGGASGSAALGREISALQVRGAADVDRSSGHRDGTDYRITQLRGSAEREMSGARVTGDVGIGVRQFGAADFYSPFASFEDTRSTTAALRVDAPLFTGAIHTRRHSDVFTLKRDDPAFYQNRHLSWQSGAEGALRLAPMPNVNVSIGGELLDARLESARLGDHTELRKSAFGEASIGRVGGATLDVGLRGDWSSVVGAFASPSVSAALPVGNRAQLRGSFGRGFRAPNWTERYYRDPANIGDSTLKVETFWSHEIGARATPVSWMSADLAYFERRASSLIDWARPAGSSATTPWHTMNFTSATYRGVEGKISLPALLGADWVVRGSGLRFDASAAPGTVGKYALRPITSTFGISALTALGPRSTLTIDALRAGRAGESNHLQLNGRLVHTIGVMRLSAELMNATNTDYLDGSGKPVAPRSAFVGVAWVAP